MAVFPFQSGTPEPLLRASGMTIDYGSVRATENASFDVQEGDLVENRGRLHPADGRTALSCSRNSVSCRREKRSSRM